MLCNPKPILIFITFQVRPVCKFSQTGSSWALQVTKTPAGLLLTNLPHKPDRGTLQKKKMIYGPNTYFYRIRHELFFIVFVQLITYNANNYLLEQSKKDLLIIKT